MQTTGDMYELFRQKADLVSAFVTEIQSPQEALKYCVDLCAKKQACQLLIAGCEQPLSPQAEDLCNVKQQKIIAAPGLEESRRAELKELCGSNGIELIHDGLRNHLAGIDIGLTFVDYGIAETGTLVLESSNEDVRLTTMISEVHIGILPKSKIRPTAYDLENELKNAMQSFPNYTAFITGASRTADIERVLALGVHGPLELHILLLEDR